MLMPVTVPAQAQPALTAEQIAALMPIDPAADEEDPGVGYEPRAYASTDLWIEVSVTNSVANFDIHTSETAAYDLFGTTNFSSDVPGLNGTNWVCLLRTEVGQTNNILLASLWPETGFFRLGTLLDSDGDGLTDAYEHLVAHTDPTKWDTDGDGLSDGWELEHGMNPNLDESAQAAGRLNYQYDGAGWLRVISGAWSETITLDAEGNVLQLP